MSTEFPSNWASLTFPSIRAELIEHLKDIVRAPPRSDPTYNEFHIDAIVEYLFDLTKLSEEGGYSPGEVLFDVAEERVVLDVARALDTLVSELGNASSKSYLAHPRWSEVKQHAIRALEMVSERGLPTYGP